MSQNVTLWGASYSQVPSILVPKTGGGTAQFDDTTISSNAAAAADIASGKLAYVNGSLITGTNSGGGGGGGITKVASTEYTVSTTGTSATTVDTWSTSLSSLWTAHKLIFIHLYDKQGPREGYFYGSENFLLNIAALTAGNSSTTGFYRQVIRYQSSQYAQNTYTGSTAYGVYPDTLYSDGRIRIRKRYNSGTSLTINSTYAVEVYVIDPGSGVFYPPLSS